MSAVQFLIADDHELFRRTARSFIESHPDCNVIIVTQNHETIARQQAAAVDARGAITKSEFTQELPTTIKRLFENPVSETGGAPKAETAVRPGWVRGGG